MSATLAPIQTQSEFDWQLGHARCWLTVSEVSRALDVSEDHIVNLFYDAAIDVAINIAADLETRPYYRILRASFRRFTTSTEAPTDITSTLRPYFESMPSALAAWRIARHLNCTPEHVLSFSQHYFVDASNPAASKRYIRASKQQLLTFIESRRII